MMNTIFFIVTIVSWLLILFLAFLVLGVLRSLGIVSWRLEQLEATAPRRIGRDGLLPGKRAPDFTLPCVEGGNVSLHDFAGRHMLLVFTQSGCGPCHAIVPELNKLAGRNGDLQVLMVIHAEPQVARQWADVTRARFPLLVQEDWSVSKRFEVFATPFVFLIDQQGVVASKGIVTSREHIGFLLDRSYHEGKHVQVQAATRQPDTKPIARVPFSFSL
jgi:methylamine dehydrogenase accessory protein MauD